MIRYRMTPLIGTRNADGPTDEIVRAPPADLRRSR